MLLCPAQKTYLSSEYFGSLCRTKKLSRLGAILSRTEPKKESFIQSFKPHETNTHPHTHTMYNQKIGICQHCFLMMCSLVAW